MHSQKRKEVSPKKDKTPTSAMLLDALIPICHLGHTMRLSGKGGERSETN